LTLYTKYYTVKQWGKLDKYAEKINGEEITWQQKILEKYQVILTDHQTKSEKIKGILSKFNGKNLDRAINGFKKGADKMDAVFKTWDKMKGNKKNKVDYSFLVGKKVL